MIQNFIHLRVRSAYSLLEGAIRIKELVGLCQQHELPAVAMTDVNNMFGSLEFSQAAAPSGVQPIIGAIFSLKPWGETDSRSGAVLKPDQLLLLAQTQTGYQNLLALASKAYLEPADNIGPMLSYADLELHAEGLIALTSGIYGAVGKQLLGARAPVAEQALLHLATLYPGRLYIELMRHGLADEQRIEPALLELALKHNLPLVATNDVYFADEAMFEAHDALMCIADGKYVADPERKRLTPEHRFKTPAEMRALFADLPEALDNTVKIARRCAVMSPSRAPILPAYRDAESNLSEPDLLRERGRAGLEKRLLEHVATVLKPGESFEQKAQPYRDRLEYELDVIIKMQFPGYFLIVSDFIRWSKSHDIPVGPGRGSGAGSVVAWALDITDLDPLRFGLLFERFLNPERVSMPDFDIDFCQDRRDEVIKYVQQKYGASRVAQIITFGKLQARAVLRDVGRVLQLPYMQVDGICKLVPNNPAHPVTLQEAINMEPMLRQAIAGDEAVAKMVDYALKLEGLYRHASTHAAGVVIADRPLQELVPLYRDPKSDVLVVQYSMKYAEAAGLVKFDFLGLKTLTVLKKAVDLVAKRGIEIDLLKLPEGDPKTYALLGQGDATGVFQLESAGMRDTLKRLRPDSLEDIIALVSLYRPGPMDNIPTYIARKHGLEKAEYLHPKLAEVLKETFGVIIYQEQVMQIAQLLAGYSLGEADLLRRAMGKKIRSEMEAQRENFVSRAVANGVPDEQARSIFDLIAKFAEYGFNKSHAAAYAVIAYQTAYIKANYPVEFLAASMTYDMHNTDKLSVFREEAVRYGIPLLAPDVNRSEALFSVENLADGKSAIRYGLGALKNIGAAAMQRMVDERNAGGPFKDIFDFAERLDPQVISRRQLEYLIKAGALDSIHRNRKQLFESIDMLVGYSQQVLNEKTSSQVNLFAVDGDSSATRIRPTLVVCEDWEALMRLEFEFEAVGYYLSSHPLAGYAGVLKKLGVASASQFATRLGNAYVPIRVAGIVTAAKFKVSPKGRFAFITLSDETGTYEISVFKEEIISFQREMLGEGKLIVVQADGKMEEGGPRLIAQSIQKLEDLASQHKVTANPQESVMRLVVNNADVAALKQQLGTPVAQGASVQLIVAAGKSRVVIQLPGFYFLSAAAKDQLAQMPGVKLEAA